MNTIAKRYICVIALIGIAPWFMPGIASGQTVGNLEHEVNRSVLLFNFSKNPRALAISHTRAWAARRGVSGQDLDYFVREYAREFDTQAGIASTGRLPLSTGDQAFRDLSKFALQRVAARYVGELAGATDILFDTAFEYLDSYMPGSVVDSAERFLADRNYDAVVNAERITDYILATPNIRDGLIQDIGVDIALSAADQFARHPDIANAFQSREILTGIASNARSLTLILEELSQLDASNSVQQEALRRELLTVLDEGLTWINSQTDAGITRIGGQQQMYFEELQRRAFEIEGQIGANREILFEFIEDQAARAQARMEIEEARRKAEEEAAQIRAVVQGAASLLNLIEPGFGDRYGVVVNSSMQIASAIRAFDPSVMDFASLASLASGIANPTMAIFALMQASGPSSDQLILSQLAIISRQIAELRVEMNQRFDVVDRRLADILLTVQTGMDRLSRQLDINLSATIRNLQVGLDTQTLLLSETRKLGDSIRDTVLVPCIQRVSTLALPDESFINCASFLRNNASAGIARAQIDYAAGLAPDTVANILRRTDGAGTDFLSRVWAERAGVARGDRVLPSEMQWTTSTGWYHDFLLRDPAQAKRTAIQPRFSELVDTGIALGHFRTDVLAGLAYSGGASGGSDYRPVAEYVNQGDFIFQAVTDMEGAAMNEYFAAVGFELEAIQFDYSELEWFYGRSLNSEFWEFAQTRTLADDAMARLLEELPGYMVSSVRAGMGRFVVAITYVDNDTRTESCGFLNLERRTIVQADRYRLDLFFDAPANMRAHSRIVGSMPFRVTGNFRGSCGGFLAPVPHLCSSSSCLSSAVVGQIAGFSASPVSQNELADAWTHHRNEVASAFLGKLDSPTLESHIALENAYLAALLHLALPDQLALSDGLRAIVEGTVGLPSPAKFASKIRRLRDELGASTALPLVFETRQYLHDETSALQEFFASEHYQLSLEAAASNVALLYGIERLGNANTLLAALASGQVDPGSLVPPTVQPPTVQPPTVQPPTVQPPTVQPPTSSGGGGAISLHMVLFMILLGVLGSRISSLPRANLGKQ